MQKITLKETNKTYDILTKSDLNSILSNRTIKWLYRTDKPHMVSNTLKLFLELLPQDDVIKFNRRSFKLTTKTIINELWYTSPHQCFYKLKKVLDENNVKVRWRKLNIWEFSNSWINRFWQTVFYFSYFLYLS